jgi:PAS domain S-box-containing protein
LRILIVDDHPMLRHGIRSFLETAPHMHVCGEAVDGIEAIEKASELKPDVIIMDVSMPRMNGLEATREIRRLLPQIEILILTQYESEEMARQAMKAGAKGYVVKSSVSDHLIAAIENVAGHKVAIDDAIPVLAGNAEAQNILQRDAAAEQALRESENRFRLLADTVPALVWMSGADALCNFFNKPWLEFRGRTREQELGNGWADGVHPDDLDRCLRTYVTSFEARRDFSREYRLLRADGVYRWMLDKGAPRFTENGTFAGYIGSCIDITDRKEMEQAIKANAEYLQLVTDQMVTAVTRCSRDLRYLWVNPRYAEWLGRSVDEIVGHPIVEVLGRKAFARIEPHFKRVLAGERVAYEQEADFKGIGRRLISAVYVPTIDATGKVDGWVASVTDVTEQRNQATNASSQATSIGSASAAE